jgi:hypothetical protein
MRIWNILFYVIFTIFLGCAPDPKQIIVHFDQDSYKNNGETNYKNVVASPFVDLDNSPFLNREVKDSPLRWGDINLLDLGSVSIFYDGTSGRQFKPIPSAYTHPRVLFTPDQIPDIRKRLSESSVGRKIWNNILAYTESFRGTYSKEADYNSLDYWKGSFGGIHGPVPLFRLGEARDGKIYDLLLNGDSSNKNIVDYFHVYALDAFRALIEGDQNHLQRLAKMMGTVISVARAERIRTWEQNGTSESNPPGISPGKHNMAYVYDFLYNWLTPDVRRSFREELSLLTWHASHYGTLVSAEATTSNWATFTYHITALLAIEGEEGFNDLSYVGMIKSYKNFFTYGWYSSGACYEGMGKNQLGGDGLLMFALRGENVHQHPHIKAFFENRMVKDILPHELKFVGYGRWGGLKSPNIVDIMTLRYLFPENKAIGWLYSRLMTEEESIFAGDSNLTRMDGYWNNLLIGAIVATEVDSTIPTRKEMGVKKTFLGGERNLLITRSNWNNDALYLHFQSRPANGGHQFADRNSFVLSGKGVNWFIKRDIAYKNFQNNLVVIDDVLQNPLSFGRMIDFVDSEEATFAVGDAKYTWDWNIIQGTAWRSILGIDANNFDYDELPEGTKMHKIAESSNDFSFKKREESHYSKPLFESLYFDAKKEGQKNSLVLKENFPVEKAFRSVGIVRHDDNTAYALVIDDISVGDSNTHSYNWIGQLNSSLKMWKKEESHPGTKRPSSSFKRDIYFLSSTKSAPDIGDPVLLVRVLDMNSTSSLNDITQVFDDGQDENQKKLHLKIQTTGSPNFKVLLYPFYYGQDPLPDTLWSNGNLVVRFPGLEEDNILFTTHANKLNVEIKRAGNSIARLESNPPKLTSPGDHITISKETISDNFLTKQWNFSEGIDGLELKTGHYSSEIARVVNGYLDFFDGIGHQYVNIDPNSIPDSHEFTVSMWTNLKKIEKVPFIKTNEWSLKLVYNGFIELRVHDKKVGVALTLEKVSQIFNNRWANVVISKKGKEWKVYINSELVAVYLQGEEQIKTTPEAIILGLEKDHPSYGMYGFIDDLRFYSKGISWREVLTIYQNGRE